MRTLLALITVILIPELNGFRVFNVDGEVKFLALENEVISMQCEQDTPMAYCGFVHPSGKRFSLSGSELANGHCAISITATRAEEGEWRCYIGKQLTGVELQQDIQLRVVDKVAAVQNNLTVVHNKDVTLECATTEGYRTLSYCRFEPPNGAPFSIDSAVHYNTSILGRYYFPPNRSLDRGDCAVTIRKIQYDDVGLWTCGAGMSDGEEYTDTVELMVEGMYTMSTASATSGVIFGAIGIGAFLIILGYLGWKKRSILGAAPRQADEEQELGEMPQAARCSPHSRRSSISRRSPQTRRVPSLVVQSPSEPGSSALMSRSPVDEQSSTSRRSPQTRRVPSLVVQSPSEPGSSPLMSRLPVDEQSSTSRRSPQTSRVPSLVVQLPSEPGSSPSGSPVDGQSSTSKPATDQ